MLIDARSIPDGARLDTDLCIVGAGPAGLTIARLLTARGINICLIESGGPEPEQDASIRNLSTGRNVGLEYFRLEDARGRGLGGSGKRWNVPIGERGVGVRLRPLEPIDFEARDWLPRSGWPFDYAYMQPYYWRAAALCEIEPEQPQADECARRDGHKPLGLNPDIAVTAMFQLGPANVWWGEETSAWLGKTEAKVLFNGTVTKIEAESNARRVRGVRIGTLNGHTIQVAAKIVVLACGGIDNARLLLLSDDVQRGGLGNGRDLVGRFFMEHPHLTAGVLIPARPSVFEQAARYQIQKSGNTWVEGRLALAESVARRERLRGCVVALHAAPRRAALRHLESLQNPTTGDAAGALLASALERRVWPYDAGRLARAICADPSGARRALRALRLKPVNGGFKNTQRTAYPDASEEAPEVFALNVMSEQEPHPDSRVLLDRRNRDALGQPRVKLDWRVTEDDIRAITRALGLIGREIEAAGIGRFHVPLHDTLPPKRLKGGYHHMGTTRMHTDPAQGVVDADCKVHGIDNLFIAGSSVFPTGGYANPTFTVVALAVRLADHLLQRFR
jgi:choline dehydrogenase-like flavoprotein